MRIKMFENVTKKELESMAMIRDRAVKMWAEFGNVLYPAEIRYRKHGASGPFESL